MPTTLTPEMAAALAQAEAILEHGVDGAGVPLSGIVRSVAADTVQWLSTTSLDQSRKGAQFYGGVGPTKELELEAAGIFEAFAANSRICVTSRSIARYRLANAILSRPADGFPVRVREPAGRFQKQRRAPTERELEGLRIGNAKRAEEAKQRREARS